MTGPESVLGVPYRRMIAVGGALGVVAGLLGAAILGFHAVAQPSVDWPIVAVAALCLGSALVGSIVLDATLRSFDKAARLSEAIETLSDGFALWDGAGRLVAANRAFYEHTSRHSARVGEVFEHGLRRIAEAEDFPDVSVESAEAYVRDRVEAHRHPGPPFERQHKSGRWIRIAEQRLADGGIVTLYSDITPQKTAQQENARQQARLQRIIDHLPSSVTVKDRDLRMTVWNEHAATVFGRPASQVLGRRLSDAAPSPESEFMETLDRRIIATGQPAPAQAVMIDVTGKRHEIWMTKIPLIDPDGTISGVISVGWDITEIRRVETLAAKDRRLLRDLVDALPMWVNIKDLDLRYVLVNRAQAEAFSVREADVIGRRSDALNIRGMSPEDWRAQVERNSRGDREAIESGVPKLFVEEKFRYADGGETFFWSSRIPLRDETGRVASLLTLALDVSELRRTEAALRESRELLLQSQRIGRTGYLLSDFVRDRVYWSDSLFELRQVPKREWFTVAEARSFYHPDDLAKFDRNRAAGLAEGSLYRGEIRVRRAGGGYRWELLVGHPRFDEAGRHIGTLAFIQDIDDRRAIEDALIAANRTKADFLANMSHELRTPLNAVIGYAELMTRQLAGPLAPKYLEYSGDILRSGRHLLDVISDILDMSRIEAGEARLDIAEASLPAIVDGCLRMLKVRSDERRQVLTADIAPDFPALHVDARAIRQVLINLLGNAVKFTPEAGRIALRAWATDGLATITVSDTGPGIRPEHMARIFRPFWQAGEPHTKSAEGTGLGLAISKALVELHGGTLRLDSEYGKGAVATVSLPIHGDVEKRGASAT